MTIFAVPEAMTLTIDENVRTPDPLVMAARNGMRLDERSCDGDGDPPPMLLAAPTLPSADRDATGSGWAACVTVDPSGRVTDARPASVHRDPILLRAARRLKFAPAADARPRKVRVSLRYA